MGQSVEIIICLDEEYAGDLLGKIREGILNHNGISEYVIKFITRGAVVLTITLALGGALAVNGVTSPLKGSVAEEKFNMSYVFFGTQAQQIASLQKAHGALDMVSPGYFDITTSGNLKINSINEGYVNYAHEKGLRVVPFLSNHWDRASGVAALANPEDLARQIAEGVYANNLDGVNVDIENVTEKQRDSYTELVRCLKEMMPDKEVSVAVAANPKGWNTGWHGSYDYSALSKYADYLMIMAYDEHYQGSPAGPVAGMEFVEESIKYALKHVPKEKIVLGVPFFGRVWGPGGFNGRGASLHQVAQMKQTYQVEEHYDEAEKSPYLTFTVRSGDVKMTINGATLTEGDYTVWYENDDSIKSKLYLVQKYELLGSGSWSLGQETGGVWDYYRLWTDGKYFDDIENHFAKDEILKAFQGQLMKGISNVSFGPDLSLTRAQGAAITARALSLPGGGEAPFPTFRATGQPGKLPPPARRAILKAMRTEPFGPRR